MVEVKLWSIIEARNQRFLIGKKIYSILQIIKGAYVVPAIAPSIQY